MTTPDTAALEKARDALRELIDCITDDDLTGAQQAARGIGRDALSTIDSTLAAAPVQAATPLAEMEARKDAAYEERNRCVALLARMTLAMGRHAGVARTAIEGWSEDWHGCVYIDLPTGQASWHFHDSQASLFDGLPAYSGAWDGHTTPEKYERVAAAYSEPAAQEAVPGEAPKRSILLTGAQVRDVLEFVAPDVGDADQLESEVIVEWCEARTSAEGEAMPAGMYCWLADYPEEGCIGPLGEPGPEGAQEPAEPVLSIKREEREALSPEATEKLRSTVLGGRGSAGWQQAEEKRRAGFKKTVSEMTAAVRRAQGEPAAPEGLPPLPEPTIFGTGMYSSPSVAYTADQMHAYARTALSEWVTKYGARGCCCGFAEDGETLMKICDAHKAWATALAAASREDAAMLDWLEKRRPLILRPSPGFGWSVASVLAPTLREAIRAAMAAEKGASHG